MNQDKLKALVVERARDIKTGTDPGGLTRQPARLTVETALNTGLDGHLGDAQHAPAERGSGNS